MKEGMGGVLESKRSKEDEKGEGKRGGDALTFKNIEDKKDRNEEE